MTNPEVRLRTFQAENNIYTKGPLSLVIQFTIGSGANIAT